MSEYIITPLKDLLEERRVPKSNNIYHLYTLKNILEFKEMNPKNIVYVVPFPDVARTYTKKIKNTMTLVGDKPSNFEFVDDNDKSNKISLGKYFLEDGSIDEKAFYFDFGVKSLFGKMTD